MARLNPHTLVKISDLKKVHFNGEIPEWVSAIFEETNYVVVRRGSQSKAIPIGIRGYEKSQRLAGWIDPRTILDVVTPHDAVKRLGLVNTERINLPAFKIAKKVVPLLKKYDWGIGGSLQFELVTGLPMVKMNSDIDIIMQRPNPKIEVNTAKDLLHSLENTAGTHVDIQIVHNQNGFSLEEYAQQRSSQIMLKTEQGPQLVTDPWVY